MARQMQKGIHYELLEDGLSSASDSDVNVGL